MAAKELAGMISEMLINGLHNLQRSKVEGGHDTCFSLQDVEAFCRERANNLAQGLLVDVPKQEIEERAGNLMDLWPRLMATQDMVERAIANEGSPAVKDTFGGFMVALDETLRAATKLNEVAAKHICELHKVLCVERA